ncbi:hypothetical protein [Bdellovibrio sp.]|uniref:hypothetical protein n=1 Tax=Bdellovibrio TaxID=958 RepID=UPI0032215DD0
MNKSIFAVAGLGLLLNGCGGGGGALTAAGGSVNLAQATAILNAQGISTVMQSLVPTGGSGSPVTVPAAFVGVFDSCTKKNPDPTVDDDGDGIPALLEVKFNCNRVAGDQPGYFMDRVGSYKIQDFKDAAGAENKGWGGGYRYEYDFSNSYLAPQEEFTNVYDGFFEVKNTSSKMSYSTAYTGTVRGFNKTPVYFEFNWKWQSQWTNTYIPEDMSLPYQKGSAKFDGFFGVSGVMAPDQQTGKQTEVKVVFALKSKNLRYDRSCTHYWSEGSISYIDGSNNELRYEYTCGSQTVYFNGEDITNNLVRLN